MALIKTFANAVRIKSGLNPLIVTTSEFMAEVTSDSPLLNLVTGRDTSMTESLPSRFVAVAREGLRAPEQQLWDVRVEVKGLPSETIKHGIGYNRMLDFMRSREVDGARERGFFGNDAQIIDKRKPQVAYNNVLKFLK
jgi:hypothetical protein